jgi:RES domain-containing protein
VLPGNWRDEEIPTETQAVGAEWAATGRSVLLRVPSVPVPSEHNYLANPRHPDFHRLVIGAPRDFGFEPRLATPR